MNKNDAAACLTITRKLKNSPLFIFLNEKVEKISFGKDSGNFTFKNQRTSIKQILSKLEKAEYKSINDWHHDISKCITTNFDDQNLSETEKTLLNSILEEVNKEIRKECNIIGNIYPRDWARLIIEKKDKLNKIVTGNDVVFKPKVPLISAEEVRNLMEATKELPKSEIHHIFKRIKKDNPELQLDESQDNVIDLAKLKTKTLCSIQKHVKKWFKENKKQYPHH